MRLKTIFMYDVVLMMNHINKRLVLIDIIQV